MEVSAAADGHEVTSFRVQAVMLQDHGCGDFGGAAWTGGADHFAFQILHALDVRRAHQDEQRFVVRERSSLSAARRARPRAWKNGDAGNVDSPRIEAP
jgi:hypothetical protein